MIRDLHSYPSYKPSGVEWLGDVPEHWEVRRLKYSVTLLMGQSPSSNDCSDERIGPPFLQGCAEFGAHHPNPVQFCRAPSRISPMGAILMSVRAPVGKLNTADQEYGIGRGLCAITSNERISHTGFSHYQLETLGHGLKLVSTGSTYDAVSVGDIGNQSLVLPPLPEQAAIVRYLDHTDERIRAYIRAKQKLIKCLEETKQAVIHRAVTSGMDSDVPLKPSGVEWLGDVPEHWEVRRLLTVAEMRVSNVDKHTKEDELPVRLCNYVDVYKNDRITQGMAFMNATASREEVERFRLQRDDVLITKDSESWDDIGVPALVTEPADDLLSGYHLALLRPLRQVLGAYLARTLQSRGVAYQFHVEAKGVTRYGLTHAGIQSVHIPLPPLPEQTVIVRYLDKATADIDTAVDRARRQIELLREYRTRLIGDVVSGRLDVRDVEIPGSGEEPAFDGTNDLEGETEPDEAEVMEEACCDD